MRFARSASLLVAFCLLTSAATAYADCAWVLWEHKWAEKPSRNEWTLLGAVITRGECQLGQADTEKQHQRIRKLLLDSNSTALDPNEHTQYLCLPDSVDPRRPKGK